MYVKPTAGKAHLEHDLMLYSRLANALRRTHTGYYTPNMRGMHDLQGSNLLFDYGMATFVRIGMRPETWRESTLNRPFGEANDGRPAARKIVSFTVTSARKQRYLIGHMHGLWDLKGKVDTKERMLQSQRANAHLLQHRRAERWGGALPVIFGGDFNLTSQLQAFAKLISSRHVYGPTGPTVLNHKYGVTDTRTEHYTKPEREANFVLADSSLNCTLEVVYDVPSDHAVLLCNINEE
jgi:hypothetical protein